MRLITCLASLCPTAAGWDILPFKRYSKSMLFAIGQWQFNTSTENWIPVLINLLARRCHIVRFHVVMPKFFYLIYFLCPLSWKNIFLFKNLKENSTYSPRGLIVMIWQFFYFPVSCSDVNLKNKIFIQGVLFFFFQIVHLYIWDRSLLQLDLVGINLKPCPLKSKNHGLCILFDEIAGDTRVSSCQFHLGLGWLLR